MSAERIDFAAVKAKHEGHTRHRGAYCGLGRGDGVPCDAYRLAMEAERLANALADEQRDNRSTHSERDDALSSLRVEIECRRLAQREAERLAGKVARAVPRVASAAYSAHMEAIQDEWPLFEYLDEREQEHWLGVARVALADQPEQVQP